MLINDLTVLIEDIELFLLFPPLISATYILQCPHDIHVHLFCFDLHTFNLFLLRSRASTCPTSNCGRGTSLLWQELVYIISYFLLAWLTFWHHDIIYILFYIMTSFSIFRPHDVLFHVMTNYPFSHTSDLLHAENSCEINPSYMVFMICNFAHFYLAWLMCLKV